MEFPKRIICILGMHRSGTSCLTGSLQDAGVSLGECHTWNPYNLKGNRENQDFVDLHDAILNANDGAWDKPPRKVKWAALHRQRAQQLLQSAAQHEVFGFKDPRTLLVLDGWKDIVGNMEFVGIFRHPNSVAQSLENRSAMSRLEALALWYHYNRKLYRQWRKTPFPILCFDAPDAEFQNKLQSVVAQLQLPSPEPEQPFYDSELKTHDVEQGTRLPWNVARLYRQLLSLSV